MAGQLQALTYSPLLLFIPLILLPSPSSVHILILLLCWASGSGPSQLFFSPLRSRLLPLPLVYLLRMRQSQTIKHPNIFLFSSFFYGKTHVMWKDRSKIQVCGHTERTLSLWSHVKHLNLPIYSYSRMVYASLSLSCKLWELDVCLQSLNESAK